MLFRSPYNEYTDGLTTTAADIPSNNSENACKKLIRRTSQVSRILCTGKRKDVVIDSTMLKHEISERYFERPSINIFQDTFNKKVSTVAKNAALPSF